MIGAFRVTLVPGAGWQEAEPLQVLWEHQPQVGTRAGDCRPQAGPGETEAGPDIRALGCSTQVGKSPAPPSPGTPGLGAQCREQALH